jgi:hypothetical protein
MVVPPLPWISWLPATGWCHPYHSWFPVPDGITLTLTQLIAFCGMVTPLKAYAAVWLFRIVLPSLRIGWSPVPGWCRPYPDELHYGSGHHAEEAVGRQVRTLWMWFPTTFTLYYTDSYSVLMYYREIVFISCSTMHNGTRTLVLWARCLTQNMPIAMVPINHRWTLTPISVISDIGLSLISELRISDWRERSPTLYQYRNKLLSDISYPTP